MPCDVVYGHVLGYEALRHGTGRPLSSPVSTNALEIFMEKIARIISIEFDTKKNKVETMAKFRSNINDLAAGLELSVVVNTDENSIIAIQIWPDQETLDAFE